jgi:hypothetical protein
VCHHQIHKLTPEELAKREVINIDIARDELPADKYKAAEDPTLVGSAKAGRGPWAADNWKVCLLFYIETAFLLMTLALCQFGMILSRTFPPL